MNSFEALCELRAAKSGQQGRRLQHERIDKQVKKIAALEEEKNEMNLLLRELFQEEEEGGGPPLSSTGGAGSEGATEAKRRDLQQLREKIALHKVVGPCGLTVVQSSPDLLVLEFTGLWKNKLSSKFLLSLSCDTDTTDGSSVRYSVKSTDIPHFIKVQTLLDSDTSGELTAVLENVEHLVSSYMCRRGEMEYVQRRYGGGGIVKKCVANEAVTYIEMTLNLEGVGEGAEEDVRHEMLHCQMTYSGLSARQPARVDVTAADDEEDNTSEEVVLRVEQHFLSQPLSDAMAQLTGATDSQRMDSQTREDSS